MITLNFILKSHYVYLYTYYIPREHKHYNFKYLNYPNKNYVNKRNKIHILDNKIKI